MIDIVPFEPEHIDAIEVQPRQLGHVLPGDWYAKAGPAWSAYDADRRLIFCGGFVPLGPSYMLAWCVMAADKRHDLLAITRAIRALLAGAGWRRVELLTHSDFAEAADWAILLGFQLESVRECALPDGGDLLCWTRIERG